MRFSITFKDPDGVSNSMDDAVRDSLAADGPADQDEYEAAKEIRHERLSNFLKKWISYSEYLTVEFDTDAGTAIVKEDK